MSERKKQSKKLALQSAVGEKFRQLTGDIDVRAESIVNPSLTEEVRIEFVADHQSQTIDIRFPQAIKGLRLPPVMAEKFIQDLLHMLHQLRKPNEEAGK